MSFTSTFDFKSYIDRGVEMLLADTTLRVPSPNEGDSLVTNVLAQEPAIDQSPNTSIIPVIHVIYPKKPLSVRQNR